MRRFALFADWLGVTPWAGHSDNDILAWVAAAAGDPGAAERLDPSVHEAALELKARDRRAGCARWLCVRPDRTRHT